MPEVDGRTGTAGRRVRGGMRRRRVDRDGREPERRGDLAGTLGASAELRRLGGPTTSTPAVGENLPGSRRVPVR
jgi:hypothetical protein